ncbi:MAG: DNA-deoxyinosine glycosylase [Clostridium sp.]|nr:DNA-deoxyinosine glycosylase [Clostridium sp.]
MPVHPFPALYNGRSRILILGSFPSVKSREANFFYGHPRNRFWELTARLRKAPVPRTIEEKKAFLLENGIALWDVIKSCDIRGSSDSSIKNVIPNDLSEILDHAPIEMIYCNGTTSWNLYEKYIRPATGIPAVKLPSTSPANAAWTLEKLEKAWQRINIPLDMPVSYRRCTLCPRQCGIDRFREKGFCELPPYPVLARAALHPWEEPVISGTRGSGTVFFSGCNLRCSFCQNYKISQENFGKAVSSGRLSEIFLELQEQGAHNINLVTAAPYLPSVLEALEAVRGDLRIPVVYNSGGYETEEAVELLSPYVSVWLPDLKYRDPALAASLSRAGDYYDRAILAIRAMIRHAGPPVLEDGLLKRGVVIRHLVLPGHKEDSIALLHEIKKELPEGSFLISLMSQYTPYRKSTEHPEINRRITTYEYNKVLDAAIELGLDRGFMQEKSSAKEEYTPPFSLEGV